jgi:HTH-type transcriptional repressor of puuD
VIVLRQREVGPFDRGTGVVTLPYVGKWNSDEARFTTGSTIFERGACLRPARHPDDVRHRRDLRAPVG